MTTAPTVIPRLVRIIPGKRDSSLTCNKITNKPLDVVATDPMSEWEETVEVLAKLRPRGKDFTEPVHGCGLFLDICIRRADREHTFSASNTI
jgi:hypothetical protein